MRVRCITYGITHFDKRKFYGACASANNKPDGGFWTAPAGRIYGWYKWCVENEFKIEDLKQRAHMWVTGHGLVINGRVDFEHYVNCGYISYNVYGDLTLDWTTIRHRGEYDFVWVTERALDECYNEFYGWDVESIVVLNPKCVKNIQV